MNGILVVDKPQGMTSHDVVAFIRRRFAVKKVGHAGTLDPMATGVLIALLGTATKSSATLITDDKEYEATFTLGASSDTGDAWGTIVPSPSSCVLTDAAVIAAVNTFIGAIDQVPPSYSAVKYKGKKLYEFARKGIAVTVAARPVVIHAIRITHLALPYIDCIVSCSKGTYIRQLCIDIGAKLGCGAYVSQLRRTRSGRFTLDTALTVDALRTMSPHEVTTRLCHV